MIDIDVLGQLIPNPVTMLVQLCSTLVLFLLMKKTPTADTERIYEAPYAVFLAIMPEKVLAQSGSTEDIDDDDQIYTW